MKQGWVRRFRESPPHTQTNIVCTAIIMVATVAYAIVAGLQLSAIRGQLEVMRGALSDSQRSGETTTNQIWQAVGNVNWMARTADQSSRNTYGEMENQSRALRESADSEISANRAWIVPDLPPQHKGSIEEANLEWHNAGKTPAVSVFSTAEYFTGELPRRLRTCVEMERTLKKQPIDRWQFQGFVAENGRYETGLGHAPAWVGQQPIFVHGCVWYTDVLSGVERDTEFFFLAFQDKFAWPKSEGVSLFFLADRPLIYK
jgi:hypothetical protein